MQRASRSGTDQYPNDPLGAFIVQLVKTASPIKNELDARIGVGSGTTILTNQTIYNHSVDDLLSRLDVEEESCVLQPSEK